MPTPKEMIAEIKKNVGTRLAEVQKAVDWLNKTFKDDLPNTTFVIMAPTAIVTTAFNRRQFSDADEENPITDFCLHISAFSHPKLKGKVIENRQCRLWNTQNFMRLSDKKIATIGERIYKTIMDRPDVLGFLVFNDTAGFGYTEGQNKGEGFSGMPNAYPLAINQQISQHYESIISE